MDKQKNKSLVFALLILIGAIVAVSVIGIFMLRPEKPMWVGEVEAKEVRVSGKVPGRIEHFYVEEGMQVKAGDTLVRLSSPEITAKLQQATAVEQAASAQRDKAEKGARAEQIEGAFEQYQQAKAGEEIAQKTFDRVQNLYNKGVMPAQKRDEAEANYKASVAVAKAAKSQYDLAVSGAQKEDKEAAQALLNQAQGVVSEVEAYQKETCLHSPITGEISDIFPKEGELVGTGAPIMNVVDLNDVWVIFNVREDKLANVQQGQEFEAIVPALGNKTITLKVVRLKALGSYATWKATKVSGDFDLKSFEVKAKPTEKIEGLRPGMSVRANIN
ncbi:MAG: efflux RND transporter periplasmic adaptor subunit [Prevotellaceae bacterium]|jgi:HlyD family secretion protein|nr:efflux RND transporter periplasmic adaptor subunit [Prevotellaceae bacterium]